MKITTYFALAAVPLFSASALAQRVEPVNSLGRARATYEASDTDKNGKVSLEEFARQKLTIPRADFSAMDYDKDGAWSREEFLVYYRRLLINSGQRPDGELESEVARIQALRRAKEREQTRPASQPPKVERPAPSDVTAALTKAIEDLEKRVALNQARGEDFQRVREGLVERARQMNAEDPSVPSDLAARFTAAVGQLETLAQKGEYSREKFTELRELLITRGRAAAGSTPAPASQQPATPSTPPTVEGLQAALDAALDDLSTKALARNATREDYARVKAAYAARARAAAPGAGPATPEERATLEQRFFGALDRLETNAREGSLTREDFQKVREAYVTRARAITAPTAEPQAPAPPPVPATGTPSNPGDLAALVDAALDELGRKAIERQPTREDFTRVREAMVARARALASTDPAAAGRQATLDDLFDKAMTKLEEDALAGRFSREEFQTKRESYIARARTIVAGSAPVAQPPAQPPVPTPAPAADETIERRFEDALAALQRKALARNATRGDFEAVSNLLGARARRAVSQEVGAPVGDDDPRVRDLVTRFQGVLSRLESAAAAGGVSAADFTQLRESLILRARENVPPAPAPVPAPEVRPTEPPKPVEAPKTEDPPRGRTRPAPEEKPADPPKEGRTGRPATPPPRG